MHHTITHSVRIFTIALSSLFNSSSYFWPRTVVSTTRPRRATF